MVRTRDFQSRNEGSTSLTGHYSIVLAKTITMNPYNKGYEGFGNLSALDDTESDSISKPRGRARVKANKRVRAQVRKTIRHFLEGKLDEQEE